MMTDTMIYVRNSVRLLGLFILVLGFGLSFYQAGSIVWTGTVPEWTLYSLISIPRWLRHAPLLMQVLCGWPWVVGEIVPLPLVCLVGGLWALRV